MNGGLDNRYRTFWPRFWAGWIDTLLFLLVLPIDSLIQVATKNHYLLAVWFVVDTFLFVAYSVAMHARYGQTLGKMITGVKVLDLAGGKLSLRQAFLRDSIPILLCAVAIAGALPSVLAGSDPDAGGEPTWVLALELYGSVMWFAVELLTMLSNSKRRAVHDFIAHTVVVRLSALRHVAHDDTAAT